MLIDETIAEGSDDNDDITMARNVEWSRASLLVLQRSSVGKTGSLMLPLNALWV